MTGQVTASGARRRARRIEILGSAVAAFRRRGFYGASMEEIARAVGMRKGNLYYYFESKEALLYFCHDYSLDILLARLSAVQKQRARADRKLRQLIAAFIHMILDELHGTALTMDLQALSRPHFRKVRKKRDRFEHGLRSLIAAGIRGGVFGPGDPKLYTFAVLGAANWITRWYDPKGAKTSTQIADAFADFLLAGLRPAGTNLERSTLASAGAEQRLPGAPDPAGTRSSPRARR